MDLQDNILLGVILFFVLAKHNRICRIWTFQFIQGRPLGLAGRALALGCYRGAWALHWALSVGLASGPSSSFFKPHQLPPSPCERNAWARAVSLLVSVAISTRLFEAGLVKALSPSYVL